MIGAAATPKTKIRRRRRRLPVVIVVAFVWLAVITLAAIFAHALAPHDMAAINLRARLLPPDPFGEYLLGTDDLGRDVFSRTLASVQTSLLIALLGTGIGALLGTVLGLVATHFRGLVDDLIMTLVDFQASMPFLIIALTMLAFFGNHFILFVLVVGLLGWERYARVVRSVTLVVQNQTYVLAVRQLGAGPLRLYLRHILPNVMNVIIVNMTLVFPEIILLESGLSFLGVGIQPPLTSLGSMLGFGRDYLTSAPWIALAPSAVLFFTALSISLVGDWLRDKLDPNLRSRAE
ncbi:ABC transporter permease [Pikeienuella piscinae]|uniref:ABC transporter permease n=1 Tax=Pikeienuella piscinae TaxID=2748098 RepID=A0A7L5C3Z9_9RHOB|nr:ABC transporter permease [Pikeienuella piscinae]QIE56649.1 ABC transporter permease [Pikeienuella piscinae]